MKPFSQIYVESFLMKSMLEGIPESERTEFIRSIQSFMSAYDHLVTKSPEFLVGTHETQGDLVGGNNPPTRRPPRRN